MQYTGSIKNRLTSIILLVTILMALIGYSSFVYWYMNDQHKKTISQSNSLGLVLSQDFAKLILLNDISTASDITSRLKPFDKLKTLVLYKLDEKVIYLYNKENKTFKPKPLPPLNKRVKNQIENKNFKLYLDASYSGVKVGYVEFNFEIESLEEILSKHIKFLLLILIIMVLFSYILADYFAKRFTSPILKLVNFLEKVDLSSSLDNKIEVKENNEYGKLYKEVNTMLERIKNSHDELKLAAVSFETQSGIIITNAKNKIIKVNKSFSRITGYKQEEVIGKTPAVLKSGLQDKDFYENMYEDLEKNNIWIGEIKNKHKSGQIVNEQLTIQRVLNKEGKVIYHVASFLDLTKQKEIEKTLQEKERMLIHQSKMASMGEMIGNIAHQWRQPLSVVSSISSSLQVQQQLGLSNFSNDDLKQLQKIDQSIGYLSQTIEDFREFFKPDKEKVNFNVYVCYTKTLDLIQSKFKAYNIELIENIDKDINITSLENELMQIIMNILNNARDILEEKKTRKKTRIYKYTKNYF